MPAATDQQMQAFSDQYVRPIAEALRAIKVRCEAAQSVIDDIYARGASAERWNDNRTDPPHLLMSGDGANPDDMLNFNTAMAMVNKLFTGSFADVNEANSFAANWAVLQDACVRPIEVNGI